MPLATSFGIVSALFAATTVIQIWSWNPCEAAEKGDAAVDRAREVRLPEPWGVEARWSGWRRRHGFAEVKGASDGAAIRETNDRKPESVETNATQRANVIEHTARVIDRFQLRGHEIDDGVTTRWTVTSGTGTITLQDHDGSPLKDSVEKLWKEATVRPPAEPQEPAAELKDQPVPVRFSSRPLLAKSVYRDNWKLEWALHDSETGDDAVIRLNQTGHLMVHSGADRLFDVSIQSGLFTRELNLADRTTILDLTAATVENFSFATPRPDEQKLNADAGNKQKKRSQAILLLHTGNFVEDYQLGVRETDLDNNHSFRSAVKKLIEATVKIAEPSTD